MIIVASHEMIAEFISLFTPFPDFRFEVSNRQDKPIGLKHHIVGAPHCCKKPEMSLYAAWGAF